MVARAVYTLPDFDKSRVHTIITQATPHQLPVITLDLNIAQFYASVNNLWHNERNVSLPHVTVLSTGGGFRDTRVRSDLTSMIGVSITNAQSFLALRC
jgi:glycosylphosphatidylinositol deacylase